MENLDQIKVEKQTHPELSILSPFDLSVEYSQFPAEKFLGDSHYALQFCIVLHGSAEVLFEKFSREFKEGELWWNMCWEPHAYRLSGRRNFILAVNIDVEQLGSCSPFSGCNWLTPFIAHPENRYCPANDKERNFIVNAGKELYHLYQHQNNNWRISSWLLIHQILLYAINRMNWSELEDTMGRDSANSFPRIRQALNKVWTSEARPPNLSEAAKMCSLSPSRFSELFSRTMGVSYGKFALRVRMSNAAKDLMSGRYTLEEIAIKWGFFDSAHFCHSFKKFYGVSPSKFVSRKNF